MHGAELRFIEQSIASFCCPKCGGDLRVRDAAPACAKCGLTFKPDEGLLSFFWPNEWDSSKTDVTDQIKSFYEETPFPNYDEFDSVASLLEKARTGMFAKMLDDQIPAGARVLECGCGTGQLTNFLSITNRTVIGTDICLNSLKLASAFKEKCGLDRAHFFQMNLFRPCFKAATFDLVVSNGVLHHTSDPFGAFQSIARLVKPNRYIIVGLYHRYGRLLTDLRRWLFSASKDKLKFLDPRNISTSISQAKRQAWFMDQYKNPHESKHTVSEVLGWLEKTGFEFVRSIPKTRPFTKFDEKERLFTPDPPGNSMERLMADLGMIFTGTAEGGFFIVIAKKPKES